MQTPTQSPQPMTAAERETQRGEIEGAAEATTRPAPLTTVVPEPWRPKILPICLDDMRWGQLAMVSNDRMFRTVLELMTHAWKQNPPGSLKDYGDRFHRVANETSAWWRRHGSTALSHFVLCSDGRYYHPTLAKVANENKPGRRLDISQAAWAKIRAEVFARDGWQCVYCQEKEKPLDCDHVVPLVSGGTSVHDNLVTACSSCNRSKGAKSLEEWQA